MGAFLIHEPKCVFIHIPKVAGASIRRGIFKENYKGPIFGEFPEEWDTLFKFCFVRNPYDRIVSTWKMFTSGMKNSKWKFQEENHLPNLTFEAFLEIATDESIDYRKRSNYKEILRHHSIPQTHFYHCFPYADFVGRFESLESDFSKVAEIIGLKDFKFSHWNKTNRKPYQNYYTDKTYDLVTKHYQEDLNTLNYHF